MSATLKIYPETRSGWLFDLSPNGPRDRDKRGVRSYPLASSKSVYKKSPEKFAGWSQKKNIYFLCPFHEERTPSCVWVSAKLFFHCFGCGRVGTAAQLLSALRSPHSCKPEPFGEVLPFRARTLETSDFPF